MLNKDLGFEKEQVYVLRQAHVIGKKIESFKEEIRTIPGVLNISASTAVPGHNNNNNGYRIKGRPEESFLMFTNWADYDYVDTYGIQLESGRFFESSYSTDKDACIVNESAVKAFVLEDPYSTRFMNMDDETGEVTYMPILGVARDFHHESLRSSIAPYVLKFKPEDMNWGYISIKLAASASSQTLESIESVWASFTNNFPVQSFFMDEDFDRLYKEERQNSHLAILFTIVGIVIASLGLYGLTSFTVAQRTKEIGVRKTFGATVQNIWFLVAKDIIILIAISTLIAWPLIYWVADNWLQNYHYRIILQAGDFLIGFVIALGIAIATITHQTVKTALVNPSKSLRYE
jgi:putative ABC transport system permease protein